MKKLFIFVFIFTIALFYTGFQTQASYYMNEFNDAPSTVPDGQLIYVDGPSYEGSSYASLSGKIHKEGDDDSYKFVLYRYVKLSITFTEAFSFDYTICLYDDQSENLYPNVTCGAELFTGIMLTPGVYSILIETDGRLFNPPSYDDRYPYTIDFEVDDEPYRDENYTSYNVYDEVVKQMKVATWTNKYDPTNSYCSFDGDCVLRKYYDDEYLYHRIYSYDPQFTYFLSSMFSLLADKMTELYDENLRIQDTYDMVSDVLSTAAQVGISYYIPNKEASSVVSKIATVLIDETFEMMAQKEIEKLNNQVVQDTPFLGVPMANNDYFCDIDNNGIDDSSNTRDSLECIAEKSVKDYYDITLIENIIHELYEGQTIGEFAYMLNEISTQLLTVVSLMRIDDQIAIDVYKTIDMNMMNRRLFTEISRIEFNQTETKSGSQSNEGLFSKRFMNQDIEVNNYINTDYGDFDFYYSDNNLTDGAYPTIFFPTTLMGNIDNYIYFNPTNELLKSKLMLIEIGSLLPLSQLLYGTTAYDYGQGFLQPSIKSSTSLDRYYNYTQQDVGEAIFTVTDNEGKTTESKMYFLTYSWEYPYKKQEYKMVDDWRPIYTGTAYFSYTHSGFERLQGTSKYVYNATGAPESYYKRENFEYHDYVCFDIYKKKNKLLVIHDDVYMKNVCYLVDESPATTNANDYDNTTYYTNTNFYSTTSTYISNYWNVDNIEGSTRRVYMDNRADVSLGDYYVKYIQNYDNYTFKYRGDSYVWAKSPTNGIQGDYYYFYYKQSMGTFTDAYGQLRTSSVRYPAEFDFFSNYGTYKWVDVYGTFYFVNQPSSTSTIRYVRIDGNRRQRFYP
jgi:hypothetical protein